MSISSTETSLIPQWGDAAEMFGTSQSLITKTEEYIDQINRLVGQIFPPVISVNFPTVANPPKPILADAPTLIDVAWQTPVQPAAFSGDLDISRYLPGAFNGVQPTLNFGAQPGAFVGQAPASPPIDLNFQYPTVQIVLPDPPSLLSIADVAFNPLNIPQFTAGVPELTISPPTPLPYIEKAFYTSQTLTDVQTSIQLALTDNTDTGLSAATQQAMFDAAREREYRTMADALADLERMEELGFAFAPGVYLDARIKMQTEMHNTTAGLSREIMVKQAEMHLENVMKSRELAISLESRLIDYYNNIATRSFEAAKYITDASVAIYNAQVQAYAARLEGFKATVTAYEASIRGIEAQVEQLKAQIAFEQTKAEINNSLISQYKVEVDAALATLDVYKTQVSIIQVQASIEKTKVDAFAAQIQAYTGEINAYTAQVEAYKANVEAQGAIENVYKTQVDAYSAEVNAGVSAANALVAEYRGRIEAYTAQLDGYKAALQAMVEQARSAAEYNTAQTEAYRALVSAQGTYNEVLTKQWEAVLNEQVQITQVAVKAAEANGQLYISARQLSLDAAKTGAQVAAQLGAAALNAIHWSNSANWSLSSSSVLSTSQSTSDSTNHNYNASI